MTLLRGLLGTEVGRYLLLAAVVVGLGVWGWDARFSAGRASVLAEQASAAARASADAAMKSLDDYIAGAEAQEAIGAEQEKRHAAALAEKDRTIAALRAGTVQLRDHWQCLPADAATAPGAGSDDAAERRFQGAGDLVQVADSADADLAACQATVTEYQRIGVLRSRP